MEIRQTWPVSHPDCNLELGLVWPYRNQRPYWVAVVVQLGTAFRCNSIRTPTDIALPEAIILPQKLINVIIIDKTSLSSYQLPCWRYGYQLILIRLYYWMGRDWLKAWRLGQVFVKVRESLLVQSLQSLLEVQEWTFGQVGSSTCLWAHKGSYH